jgi:hypothetical protein
MTDAGMPHVYTGEIMFSEAARVLSGLLAEII